MDFNNILDYIYHIPRKLDETKETYKKNMRKKI